MWLIKITCVLLCGTVASSTAFAAVIKTVQQTSSPTFRRVQKSDFSLQNMRVFRKSANVGSDVFNPRLVAAASGATVTGLGAYYLSSGKAYKFAKSQIYKGEKRQVDSIYS